MKVHELKTLQLYFGDVLANRKLFEIRKNDRDFHLGDTLWLREIDDEGAYTGRELEREVVYLMTAFRQGPADAMIDVIAADYVVMGLAPVLKYRKRVLYALKVIRENCHVLGTSRIEDLALRQAAIQADGQAANLTAALEIPLEELGMSFNSEYIYADLDHSAQTIVTRESIAEALLRGDPDGVDAKREAYRRAGFVPMLFNGPSQRLINCTNCKGGTDPKTLSTCNECGGTGDTANGVPLCKHGKTTAHTVFLDTHPNGRSERCLGPVAFGEYIGMQTKVDDTVVALRPMSVDGVLEFSVGIDRWSQEANVLDRTVRHRVAVQQTPEQFRKLRDAMTVVLNAHTAGTQVDASDALGNVLADQFERWAKQRDLEQKIGEHGGLANAGRSYRTDLLREAVAMLRQRGSQDRELVAKIAALKRPIAPYAGGVYTKAEVNMWNDALDRVIALLDAHGAGVKGCADCGMRAGCACGGYEQGKMA